MLVKYIVLPEKSAYSKIFSVKPQPITTLWYVLHTISDYRRAQGKRHPLPIVLCIAIMAMCCGQFSYEAMSDWSENYQGMLERYIPFLAGHMPCAATFHLVFKKLDNIAFEQVVGNWLQNIIPAEKGEGIAMDGKTLHGTGIHLVSAFAHLAKSVLFQMGTDIKLVVGPEVLKHITIKNHVVTGDALFAQRNLCEQIIGDGGGFVFRVKGNQETLEQDIRLFFQNLPFGVHTETYTTVDRWKGQKEIREVSISKNQQLLSYVNWPGLTHVWQMKKTVTKKEKTITETSVGIAGLPQEIIKDKNEAEMIAGYIRGHWGIENRLHRQRDVIFHEDHATIRCGNAPQIMASLKNLVISVFHRATVRSFPKAMRRFAAKPEELFQFLGLTMVSAA